jgi:electron transfer flavoprotein alpha subunit
MSTASKDVWVFVDHMDGRVRPVSLELLGEARRLANAASGRVEAVLFGQDCDGFAPLVAAHGADQLRVIETDRANSYDPETFSQTLGDLCKCLEPSLVLFPATSTGADLAARIAAAHGWPLFPRAVDIRARDGEWEITRALAAGRIHVRLTPSADAPTLVTFAPEVLGTATQDLTRSATLVRDVLAKPDMRRVDVRGFVRASPETIDLTEAETVVSAGRGLGAPGNIKLVEELAAALGGSVGGTRVAVDLGWLPKARQVGQTGKTVRPRLYVACGLSGATQHVMGMKQSETIVAINTDPNAPIFKIADLAVAADAIGLLPTLTEKCARAKKGGAT